MKSLAEALCAVALTLWIGGLWVIGYLVAPTLFYTLSDRALAGSLAGKLLNAQRCRLRLVRRGGLRLGATLAGRALTSPSGSGR